MQFKIDGSIYFLPKESYVIREFGVCSVMIMSSPYMSEWILGLNFFGNYYTVFDQENLKVGFANSIYATESMHDLFVEALLVKEIENKQKNETLIVISTIIVLISVCVLYKKFKTEANKSGNSYTSISEGDNQPLNERIDSSF